VSGVLHCTYVFHVVRYVVSIPVSYIGLSFVSNMMLYSVVDGGLMQDE